MKFYLEIADFNKIQITELLKLLDKLTYNYIKELYLNSPEFKTKPLSIEQNLTFIYEKIDKSKKILNKALKNNNIEYNELVELSDFIYNKILVNRTINPFILYLIRFYIYNLIYDIDYILEKKIEPYIIDFNGINLSYNNTNETKFILIKNYLSKITIKNFSPKEIKNFQDFENDFFIENGKKLNKFFWISYNYINKHEKDIPKEIPFPKELSLHYFIKKDDIISPLKLTIITNEEFLNDIVFSIKTLFNKTEKREQYISIIKDIIDSSDSIDHNKLSQNLNQYLKTFGDIYELEKLNIKYKNQLKIFELKEHLLYIMEILQKVLIKISDEDILFTNIINLLIYYIDVNLLRGKFKILENNYIYLFLLQEIRNLYKPSYFDINSKPPIENLEFIINTFNELFDFYIDYININYEPSVSPPNYVPIIRGGFKKLLKKYK